MPKYIKKPVVVEAIQYDGTVQDVVDFAGFKNTEMNEDITKLYIKTLEGDMLVSHGDYVIKGVDGEFYPCKPRIFEKTYDRVDLLKKARKMAELSGMVTKCGVNFTEKYGHHKKEKIEKVESFEFHFDGKTKSKIEYKTMKDGSRYHTERAFFNFELDDNLREELQDIIGRIAEHFFENDKTLPMIEHTGITNAKITNSPSLAIATSGINADFSGVKLDIPVKTAKIKDLSADKIKPGPIESPEISPASSFEIEREAHKKLIKELIREVLSEKPVTVSLDGKEIAEACAEVFTKSMKRRR
ncbi:hypothetical protein ABE321_16025 [Bacillus paralicheniformis]|nr:hypothetical protein [Bacillus paralicheniformis]TWK23052.1 hypothetical protein CHCC20372_3459 [Bacillus paralicheniformis]